MTEIDMTPAEVAAAKEYNRLSRQKSAEARARQRRHNRTVTELKDQRADLMRQVRALDTAISVEREDAWEAHCKAMEAATDTLPVPFDAEPESVSDAGEWSRHLRRRAWATAFADRTARRPFCGTTGNRDLMLFLSLCALVERHGAQTVEVDIPDMVRVAAMDNKTIVAGLQALRDSGLLLRVGVHSHTPVGSPLLPVSEAPELPQAGLAGRFCWGDREHDAFGGRHGIKPVWIRTWVWLYLHPGSSRAEVAKRAGPKGQTAYRVVEEMEKARLARIDEDGRCFVIEPQMTVSQWLDHYAYKRGLYGAMDTRMERARLPVYLYMKQKRSGQGDKTVAGVPSVRMLDEKILAELDLSGWEMPED